MIKHTNCKILDTRKTTPNFRYAEKFAVMIGGGNNHRMGLFDAILIKDNHIDYCGGMKNTLKKTEKYLNKLNKKLDVVVECRNQKEIDSAINFDFVNRILLDNYNPKELIKEHEEGNTTISDFLFGNDNKEITGLVDKSKGDLEVLVGRVVSWDAKALKDGGWDCSIEIVSENDAILDHEISEENLLKQRLVYKELNKKK